MPRSCLLGFPPVWTQVSKQPFPNRNLSLPLFFSSLPFRFNIFLCPLSDCSRGDATTWLTTTRKGAQRLHNSRRRCIHPMLRGWPPVHRSTGNSHKAFQEHPATRSPTTNRRPHSWQYHNTISFLGRNICNTGDYYEISLAHSYTTELLEEAGMSNRNPAPAPGNNTLTATWEMEQ